MDRCKRVGGCVQTHLHPPPEGFTVAGLVRHENLPEKPSYIMRENRFFVKDCSTQSRCMDILKMLTELKAERNTIEEAIVVLERLARGQGKRRGRPPAWMTAMKPGTSTPDSGAPRRRGRPPGSKNKPKPEPEPGR